jgi:hypothetical protein
MTCSLIDMQSQLCFATLNCAPTSPIQLLIRHCLEPVQLISIPIFPCIPTLLQEVPL